LASQPFGNFTFVLHAHLPYVLAHGRWPHGTDWLCECAAESYLPTLDILFRLVEEGHSPQLTMGITPVLAEQLSDDSFKSEFEHYLDQRIASAAENEAEFASQAFSHRAGLAKMWSEFFSGVKQRFREKYNRDLIGAFRHLQDEGHIEVITGAATHGYLPLLGLDSSVRAQVAVGAAAYQRHFGRKPAGFWLPECGYRPGYSWKAPVESALGPGEFARRGVEEFLSEREIDYFIVDSHLLRGGEAVGVYISRFPALKVLWQQFADQYHPTPQNEELSDYRTYFVRSREDIRPVTVLTRDPRTGMQVWSGEWGYPGDGWYLDFHKKHFPGGHRYWRVTSPKCDLADKWEYEPARAAERIPEQADHFKNLVKDLLGAHRARFSEAGIVCAPYDAELFGHWWFEGPQWLYHVLKWMDQDPEIRLVTCSQHLAENPPKGGVALPEGSWGEGGFHWIWLNEWTTWTWKHVYDAEVEMRSLLAEFPAAQQQLREVLEQAARELLLLESSDWQFLISTWTARDYAEARVSEHYSCFKRLADLARKIGRRQEISAEEWNYLSAIRQRDGLFAALDLGLFA
jgi:1,4-alpha-glucan branching enzyme